MDGYIHLYSSTSHSRNLLRSHYRPCTLCCGLAYILLCAWPLAQSSPLCTSSSIGGSRGYKCRATFCINESCYGRGLLVWGCVCARFVDHCSRLFLHWFLATA